MASVMVDSRSVQARMKPNNLTVVTKAEVEAMAVGQLQAMTQDGGG